MAISMWLPQHRWQLINFVKLILHPWGFNFVSMGVSYLIISEGLRSLKSAILHNPHQLKCFCSSIVKEFSLTSQFTEKEIL